MDNNYCVYKHTTPNGKAYIGITRRSPSERWANGLGYTCHKHGYFWKAVEKYGWENIQHEVLQSGISEEEANYYEKLYISLYQSNDKRYGYNSQSGGTNGYRYTEDAKKNISNGVKKHYEINGKPDTSKAREALQKRQGRKIVQYDLDGNKLCEHESALCAERATGISNKRINAALCAPERNKQAGGYMWRYKENATDKILPYKQQIPVVQYDLNGNKVKEWDDIKQAEKSTGHPHRCFVEKSCKKIYKYAYGYIWRYKADNPPDKLPVNEQQGRPVIQYDANGTKIREWNSVEAQAVFGKKISSALRGVNKTSCGYIWKYADEEAAV